MYQSVRIYLFEESRDVIKRNVDFYNAGKQYKSRLIHPRMARKFISIPQTYWLFIITREGYSNKNTVMKCIRFKDERENLFSFFFLFLYKINQSRLYAQILSDFFAPHTEFQINKSTIIS